MIPQLRNFVQESDERVGGNNPMELLSVSQTRGVIPRSQITENEARADSFEKYKVVKVGDIVLNRFNAYRGSLGKSSISGMVSPDYAVLRPNDGHSSFLEYWLRSDEISQAMKASMGGLGASDPDSSGFSRVDVRALLRLPIEKVQPESFDQIAEFLDRETAQIDSLIAKQQQLIGTLAERRKAVITRAVTRGLNPTVPMRDSGDNWLGKIPDHWQMKRLKDVATVQSSNVDKKMYEGDLQVLLCNYVDVYYNDFITAGLNFMEATATSSEIQKYSLRADTVLITKDSESANDIGIPAYVEKDLPGVVCGYHLSIVQPKAETSGIFLKWYFDSSSTKSVMETQSNGLTRMALGQGAINCLPIAVPGLAEQLEIGEYLKRATKQIDELVAKSKSMIGIFKERRQALISAAVTGKIDVRGK